MRKISERIFGESTMISTDLPDNWRVGTVGELVKTNEITLPNLDSFSYIKYIDTGSVERGIVNNVAELNPREAPSRARRVVRKGDILISTVRPNLRHYCRIDEIEENTIVSTGFAVLSPIHSEDSAFIYYFLTSDYITDELTRFADGGAYPAITYPLIGQLGIAIPPRLERIAIGNLLDNYDRRIKINRRINIALEATARAIFKSWFIDFDPVYAKAEGQKPFGMDDETAALFPDSFKDSELGEIPNGWKCVPLSEAFEINPKRYLEKNAASYYIDMQNMPTTGHRPLGWIIRPYKSGMRFINGDTLIARITPCLENGKTCYIDFLKDDEVAWGSTEYIVLRPRPPLPSEYGYFLAKSDNFRSWSIQNMSGTSGRQRVNPKCFDNFLIVQPTKEIAESFGKIVRKFMMMIKHLSEQSDICSQIRDALLPKLLSGEIRIPVSEDME